MPKDLTRPILVVDDVASMRQVIRGCLVQLGYTNIDEAADGAEALEKVMAKDYQWVLSDWHMAPVDGARFIRELHETLGDKAPKVVFITMDGDWNIMNHARDLGAYRLIVKPLRPSALKSSIENVLTKSVA